MIHEYGLVKITHTMALVLVLIFGAPDVDAADGDASFHRFWPDNLFAVEFVTGDVGYIGGHSGTVLRTIDGGANWDAQYIGKNELIRRVSFVSKNEGWAVGHRGSIFHTSDAGASWEVQYELPGVYLRDVDFVDKDNGWVVGHDAIILHTADGGVSWQKQEMRGFEGRDMPRFHGVYAKDSMRAVVVGEFGTVVHTEDGGALWRVTPVDSGTSWMAVQGSADRVYLAGLDGNVAYLSVATEEQRAEIDRKTAERLAKKEAKARKKAKRKKKAYVPPVVEELPRASVEYVLTQIDANTTEHFFDLAATADGVVIVGRSALMRISGDHAENLQVAEEVPLDFVWFGGVAVTPEGKIWAAGIRGMVVSSGGAAGEIVPALSLGGSKNIKLMSNRWMSSNGQ